jgi:hypothetical protein
MSQIATSIHKLPGQGVNVRVTDKISSVFTRIHVKVIDILAGTLMTCGNHRRSLVFLQGRIIQLLMIVHNSEISVPGIQSSII